MKKIIITIAALLLLTGCGESWHRTVKQWTGKFDVQFDTSGAGQVLFDRIENGERKRVVIQGGIVINEEI